MNVLIKFQSLTTGEFLKLAGWLVIVISNAPFPEQNLVRTMDLVVFTQVGGQLGRVIGNFHWDSEKDVPNNYSLFTLTNILIRENNNHGTYIVKLNGVIVSNEHMHLSIPQIIRDEAAKRNTVELHHSVVPRNHGHSSIPVCPTPNAVAPTEEINAVPETNNRFKNRSATTGKVPSCNKSPTILSGDYTRLCFDWL